MRKITFFRPNLQHNHTFFRPNFSANTTLFRPKLGNISLPHPTFHNLLKTVDNPLKEILKINLQDKNECPYIRFLHPAKERNIFFPVSFKPSFLPFP